MIDQRVVGCWADDVSDTAMDMRAGGAQQCCALHSEAARGGERRAASECRSMAGRQREMVVS